MLAVASFLAVSAHADVVIKTEDVAGTACYRMDNGRISLLVDPSHGGAVVSYRDKLGGDAELVPEKTPRGLCIDHFQSQNWPGEMYNAAYEVTDREK